jgi:hypothetical protein
VTGISVTGAGSHASGRSFESIGRASVGGGLFTDRLSPHTSLRPPNSRNTIIIILAFSQLYSSCSSMPLSRPRGDGLCSIAETVLTQKFIRHDAVCS